MVQTTVGMGNPEVFSSLGQMSIKQFISACPHFLVQEHYARRKEECAHSDEREKRGCGHAHARKICWFLVVLLGCEVKQKHGVFFSLMMCSGICTLAQNVKEKGRNKVLKELCQTVVEN